jgi:hypothetical protein
MGVFDKEGSTMRYQSLIVTLKQGTAQHIRLTSFAQIPLRRDFAKSDTVMRNWALFKGGGSKL